MGPDRRIADYISANRGKLTREAINQQLLEAGYEQGAIDATWKVLDTPDPDDRVGEAFWSRFWIYLIGINVAVVLLVGLSTGAFAPDRIGLLGILLVVLGVGALISWGIVAAVGPTRLGRTTATVIGIVIPLVFALLIGGSCYALLAAIGPPPLPQVNGEMHLQIQEPFTFETAGSAMCQPYRDGSGYGVYSQELGQLDGSQLSVSVDGTEPQPGTQSTYVSISAFSESEGRDWFNAPETQLQADVADDGLSGTVTFEGLAGGAGGNEPISGTISWSCG